ncbi:MAG: lysophospholipid acyltransferase family protein [Pseudomonadales bacterium]
MSVKYTFANAVFRLLALLPLKVSRGLGRGLGRLMCVFPNRNHRVATVNLALCFPELSDAQRADLLLERFKTLGSTVMDIPHVWSGDNALSLVTEVQGREIVDAAVAAGKGTIILAPHLGNWEVVGLYLTECCDTVKSMYSPPRSETMNQFILNARQRTGAKLVPADRSGVIQLLKTLRAGQMVGILPDQVPADESGVFAPFFDIQAFSMTLMSNLAKKTGARIVNAYALPNDTGFTVVFNEPDPDIYSDDLETSVTGMNKTIEVAAQQHKAHYQWEYKRFKRQPEGRASFYD